jgi:branched-chain amino acid transport system permease protein
MGESGRWDRILTVILVASALVAPLVLYPVFLMEALCFALFACAFNLLIGYVGLLSFGHAAFLGRSSGSSPALSWQPSSVRVSGGWRSAARASILR